jgi:PTS system nitrogen regulatory IIA component
MKLVDLLLEECIFVGAAPPDKANALAQIAATAQKSATLKDISESELLQALKEREELGSTGFGKGIAIPHCRVPGATGFTVGIVTAPGGVEFDALDEQPVTLFIFIIAPESESTQHIKLLSAVSHVLMRPGAPEEIVAQTTPPAVRDSFLRYTRTDIDSKDRTAKNLIQVLVQDEDLFHDLVTELAAADPTSVLVLEAESTLPYVQKLPLFAGFLVDSQKGFCKILLAVVDRGLTNEMIRRIESITGDLDQRTGVMLMVQELFYSAGALDTAQ